MKEELNKTMVNKITEDIVEETTPVKAKPTKEEEKKQKEQLAQEMGLVLPKNMADQINNTLEKYVKQGLVFPKDYNYQNAIVSAYIKIQQDPKLKACTTTSQVSALIKMATLGLSTSKEQAYLIPYNGELQCQPSYFGKIKAIKRIKGVKDVVADVIYKGTDYELLTDEYGNDDIKINRPCSLSEREFENIEGAWAKVILDETIWGKKSYTCIMTMKQIEKSWNQGQMKGKSPAHINFKDEMCKKSVINRCCKNFVNSSDDIDIFVETLKETIQNDYEETTPNKFIGEAQEIDI